MHFGHLKYGKLLNLTLIYLKEQSVIDHFGQVSALREALRDESNFPAESIGRSALGTRVVCVCVCLVLAVLVCKTRQDIAFI